MLLAGAVIGGGIAFAALHDRRGAGVAEVQVNGAPAKAPTTTAVDVATRLGPAVGTVIATLQGSSGLGSGFVIAKDATVSYLVTNNHVVAGATSLHVVMPDGEQFTAKLVGTDALDDIAVVSVPSTGLPQATFGTSANLRAGESVIAIGSPLGDQGSVTVGVISAPHRTITASGQAGSSSETLEDVLQTDASINPGNSGGPLADTAGNVVGVNVATAGNATNIGYSIPADLARYVAEALIAHQKVQHPFLGIGYYTTIEAIEQGTPFSGPGVLVHTVSNGTPAAHAGFQAGDILVAIDGVAIDQGQTLGGLIQPHRVGDTITCTVRRGNQTLTLKATLEERPNT
ncbi:MAG TPA: trypsin-like peptidase domain-containing protein [Candidatus Deferrimicrobium sp.]|nr:trypsin-like peptidase domain-containing protein [Candidatus Deferrimicrobium sp.]